MHIETSADARQSKRRDGSAGQPPDGAASERGFFASVASMFKAAVSGHAKSPASTADTANGAGLRSDKVFEKHVASQRPRRYMRY